MRRWMNVVIAGVLCTGGFIGCATSAEDERQEAAFHRMQAQRAAAAGDYQRADREQRKALKADREASDKTLEDLDEGKAPPPPPPQYPPPPAPAY